MSDTEWGSQGWRGDVHADDDGDAAWLERSEAWRGGTPAEEWEAPEAAMEWRGFYNGGDI